MQAHYDAVIRIPENGKWRGETLIKALERQTAVPDKIYVLIRENGQKAPFSMPESVLPAKTVLLPYPGEGSALMTALECAKAPFVLLIDGASCPTEEDYAEIMLKDFGEEPSVSAVYTRVLAGQKPKKLAKVFDDVWFDEKRVYDSTDIYRTGPGVFLQRSWSCMYRTADVKGLFADPDGISHPEFQLNARLLYSGKKIVREDRARTDYSPDFSWRVLFREGFSNAAACKMLYTEFGTNYPDVIPTFRTNYDDTKKKGLKALKKEGAVLRCPAFTFSVFLIKLGDYAGDRYHRLPARLDRFLSINEYFT